MRARGAAWTMFNTQRGSGCHGSTHLAYSNRSAIFRQRSTRHNFKSSVSNSRSQYLRLEHSNNRVSGNPGAIQIDKRELLAGDLNAGIPGRDWEGTQEYGTKYMSELYDMGWVDL